MKNYTVSARTTEIKVRLSKVEAAQLTAQNLTAKVNAKIEQSMNGDPDEEFEFDNLEEALKKFEELKSAYGTYYNSFNQLLNVYEVYIDEYEIDEDDHIDFGDTIRYFVDEIIGWNGPFNKEAWKDGEDE